MHVVCADRLLGAPSALSAEWFVCRLLSRGPARMGTDFQSPDDEFSRSRFAVALFEAMVESELFFFFSWFRLTASRGNAGFSAVVGSPPPPVSAKEWLLSGLVAPAVPAEGNPILRNGRKYSSYRTIKVELHLKKQFANFVR